MLSVGPMGMTAKAARAATSEMPGRQRVQEAIGHARPHVFLEEQLQGVGDGLQEALGPTRFGPMRTCMRLITRRSNQVMYAMPVSRPTMMTSERTTSIRISNTGEQDFPSQRVRV